MNKIYLYFSFVLFSSFSFSQSKIGYAYDSAGNRIKREIVMYASEPMAKRQSFANQGVLSERLPEHSVTIHPNPTPGNLMVSISGLRSSDDCRLSVYSVQGVRIFASDVRSATTNVDISGRPTGTYLLQISVNGETSTWKIVKK